MAKFNKKRSTKDIALSVLGGQTRGNLKEGWEIIDYNGRPRAKTVGCYGSMDFRTDLISQKASEFRTTDGQVITDKFFWPKGLNCEIDLADFYVDENGTFQHPLRGFHIKKLVEATRYPFYNQDRVSVILARLSGNYLMLNPKEPDAVVFIECWSHFDDYNTIIHDSPSEAFKIPLTTGTLWTKQLEDRDAHIGKNFIILPFGYHYNEAMEDRDQFTTEEWNQLCTKDAAKWTKIIQNFLDGNEDADEEDNKEATTETSDSHQPVNPTGTNIGAVIQDINQSVEQEMESLPIPSLRQWQQKQRDALHDLFLSEYHIKLCEEIECILQERKDRNGVQIYQIASPDERARDDMNTGFFNEIALIDDIWYHVANFIYCQEHYIAFKEFLRDTREAHVKIQAKFAELSPDTINY